MSCVILAMARGTVDRLTDICFVTVDDVAIDAVMAVTGVVLLVASFVQR